MLYIKFCLNPLTNFACIPIHGIFDISANSERETFIIVLPFDLGFEPDMSQHCPLSVTPVTMLLSQHYSMRQWIGTLTNLLQAFAIRRRHI